MQCLVLQLCLLGVLATNLAYGQKVCKDDSGKKFKVGIQIIILLFLNSFSRLASPIVLIVMCSPASRQGRITSLWRVWTPPTAVSMMRRHTGWGTCSTAPSLTIPAAQGSSSVSMVVSSADLIGLRNKIFHFSVWFLWASKNSGDILPWGVLCLQTQG